MSDRVLATQAALKAVVDLHAGVRDLQAGIKQVITLGDGLADPAVWDSPEAARFRQTEWPQSRAALPAALPVLEAVRAGAERTIRAILEAGARGQLDSPPPSPGRPSVTMPSTGDSSPMMAFAAGALVLGADMEVGGGLLDGTIFGAPVGVVLNVAGGVVLAAAAVAGIISLFARKQQPPQLSAAEEEAVANHDAGLPYDKAAYKSAVRKLNQGAKFRDERNKGKDRGQPKK